MLLLHVIAGPDRGKQFELPPDEPQLIGRSSESLPITDQTVSRRHAELTPANGQWHLRDLHSSNGTFVNGTRITTRVLLKAGDQVRCGNSLFMFAASPDEDGRPSPVALIDPHAFDIAVESRAASNDDSMVLSEPDPAAAASHHLHIVYQLSALLASTIDRDQMLEQIMELVFAEFKPDRGFILLRDDETGALESAAVKYAQRPRTLEEGVIPVSRTIVNHCLQHEEAVLSTNAMTDKRFAAGDSVQAYGIRSAICVPIRDRQRTFGVIHIDSSIANFTFTDSQMRLLKLIGQHTGLALGNARLVQERMQTERLVAVGETIASLSHSIKNILQGLRGGADAVELAINRGDLELAKEGWPILSRNLDRILALTLNMLTFSRPPALDIELTSIGALIDEVIELMQPETDRREIALVTEVDDDLAPIPLDPNAIHQALMNLLTNAVQAVPARRGVVTVRAQFDETTERAVIEVADNGPGIPEEQQEAVFEAFASTKGQRGTGLGLAVTRKIVREHGGSIELESTPGTGTIVRMVLPTDLPVGDPGDTHPPRPLAEDDPHLRI